MRYQCALHQLFYWLIYAHHFTKRSLLVSLGEIPLMFHVIIANRTYNEVTTL